MKNLLYILSLLFSLTATAQYRELRAPDNPNGYDMHNWYGILKAAGMYERGLDTISTDTIDVWGDSRSYGFALAGHQAWPALIAARHGIAIVNHSISATTLSKRTPVDPFAASPNMVDNYASIPYATATRKKAIIAYGTNDIRLNAPAYTAANFKTDFLRVLDTFYAHGYHPDSIIIVAPGYLTPTSYTDLGYGAATAARHIEFVDTCRNLAIQEGTRFADAYYYLANHLGGHNFQADSVHENEHGQMFMTDLISFVLDVPVRFSRAFAMAYNSPVTFKKIRYHNDDTLKQDRKAQVLFLDSAGFIVAASNAVVPINTTSTADAGSVYLNGQIRAGKLKADKETYTKEMYITGSNGYSTPNSYPAHYTAPYNSEFVTQVYVSDGVFGNWYVQPFGKAFVLGQIVDSGGGYKLFVNGTSKFTGLVQSNTGFQAHYFHTTAGPFYSGGAGSPEGVINAPVGSMYLRSDGAPGTLTYQKQTGTGTTGWVAIY